MMVVMKTEIRMF